MKVDGGEDGAGMISVYPQHRKGSERQLQVVQPLHVRRESCTIGTTFHRTDSQPISPDRSTHYVVLESLIGKSGSSCTLYTTMAPVRTYLSKVLLTR
jgi:hypothetical protein